MQCLDESLSFGSDDVKKASHTGGPGLRRAWPEQWVDWAKRWGSPALEDFPIWCAQQRRVSALNDRRRGS